MQENTSQAVKDRANEEFDLLPENFESPDAMPVEPEPIDYYATYKPSQVKRWKAVSNPCGRVEMSGCDADDGTSASNMFTNNSKGFYTKDGSCNVYCKQMRIPSGEKIGRIDITPGGSETKQVPEYININAPGFNTRVNFNKVPSQTKSVTFSNFGNTDYYQFTFKEQDNWGPDSVRCNDIVFYVPDWTYQD